MSPWLIDEHKKRMSGILLFQVPETIDQLQADKTNFGLGPEPVTELGRGHEQMSVLRARIPDCIYCATLPITIKSRNSEEPSIHL